MKKVYKGGFRELEVWKESRYFRNEIAKIVKTLPYHEKYRLSDQLIRASRSITSCLAEGYGRYNYQESIQFCRTSRGSLMECLDHLICANDAKYISDEELNELEIQYEKVLRLINGYISFLKKEKALKNK